MKVKIVLFLIFNSFSYEIISCSFVTAADLSDAIIELPQRSPLTKRRYQKQRRSAEACKVS